MVAPLGSDPPIFPTLDGQAEQITIRSFWASNSTKLPGFAVDD